jgi:integrase
VQAWVSDRAQVLSPSTLRLLVALLRSIFAAAVQDRLVASSPATRLSLPRSERERTVPLSVAQVQALAQAMPARSKAMVITQAGLGLRIAELLALRVHDVDFLRRTVRIEWQLTPDGKRRVPPKTPRSRRTSPLPNVAPRPWQHTSPSFRWQEMARCSQRPPACCTGRSTTVRGSSPRQSGRVAYRAGTTSHALRHHYASLLLAAGESVVAVAERLGHENATLVLTTYGHLMLDTEDRMRRAIDAAWTVDGLQTASDHG